MRNAWVAWEYFELQIRVTIATLSGYLVTQAAMWITPVGTKNHISVWNCEFTIANSQFQMWQVCCPKGSHWQLGLIYEYGSATPASNAIPRCNGKNFFSISAIFKQRFYYSRGKVIVFEKSWIGVEFWRKFRFSFSWRILNTVLSHVHTTHPHLYNSKAIQVHLTQGLWLWFL